MNHVKLIDAMERFGQFLPAVVNDVSPVDACWRPPSETEIHWSILEVICHLGDEEVDDFRTRLRLTLENPAQDWPPIDPGGWALQRRYNEGRTQDAIARFVNEREASIAWLRNLQNPDWSQAHVHPKLGPIRAGDLLAAWAAHDALHLRQISKRLFQLSQRDGAGFSTRYAGEWSA